MNTDKNKPLPYAHYSDFRYKHPRTDFCADMNKLYKDDFGYDRYQECHYDYSDRIWEWDREKAEQAVVVANASGKQKDSPAWSEEFLSHFYGYPVEIVHIMQGINHSNGHSYAVFGTIRSQI